MISRCLLAGLALALSQTPEYERVVRSKYEPGPGASAEGLGVCDIAADHATCWDMSGKPSPGLAATVDKQMRQPYWFRLPAKVGAKNRYLVVSFKGGGHYNGSFSSPVHATVLPLGLVDGDQLYLVHEVPQPGQREAKVAAYVSEWPGSLFGEAAFREGSKVKIGKDSWGIGPVKEDDSLRIFSLYIPGGKRWGFAVGTDFVGSPTCLATFEFFDRRGEPIQSVDKNGNPVGPRVFSDWVKAHRGGVPIDSIPYDRAVVEPQFSGSSIRGAAMMATNVNPSRVGKLRITLVHGERILITGFPLDPK